MPSVSTTTEEAKLRKNLSKTSKEIWNGCRSLLVPLMIAVFTITTTILQMNATRLINEQNLKIAIDNRDIANYTRLQQLQIEEEHRLLEREIEEHRREVDKHDAQKNREQDLHIANETRLHQIAIEEARLEQERRIEDERRAADFLAAENKQMDSILATYLKEMSEFLLTDNFTLENRRWAIVVRAKTLTVLRQLDGKRKSHVIQFLFEAELLTRINRKIDLSNADLNNIDMNDKKLDNISLSGASLRNASFIGTTLNNSNFSFTKLINSTFEKANLVNATFYNCDASESNFDGANLTGATFTFARLLKTTWRSTYGQKVIFYKAQLDDADFNEANLEQTRFYWTSLRGASFEGTNLKSVDWHGAKVLGANFYQADFRQSNITLKQLRSTFSYEKAKLSDGTVAEKKNLLSTPRAERLTDGNCSMRSWNSDITMVARPYAPEKVATSLGTCFFTGLEGAIRATMRQRIKFDLTKNIENMYLWVYGRCRELIPEDEFQIQFQIVQFNKENHTLADQTLSLYSQDEQSHYEKSIPCNSFTTQVEFAVIFKRQLSAPTNQPFGYCDNLRLSIYNESYS